MQFSVIIPTHNRVALLRRALSSVEVQSQAPAEVIVVDDGSEDATESMVSSLFPRVTYLRQERRGVSHARNCGIRQARFNWLAFLDSDDEWWPAKLEHQMALLQANPDRLICHTNEVWIRDSRRVNPMKKHAKSGGWIFERCLPRCVISPSSVVVHRSLLDDVGLFDETLPVCEDYDLWLRICSRFSVAYVPEPQLVKYGGHPDQLSRRYWGMDRFRIRALEKLLANEPLSRAQLRSVLSMLANKTRIVCDGARKRNNLPVASEYQRKYELYCDSLADFNRADHGTNQGDNG